MSTYFKEIDGVFRRLTLAFSEPLAIDIVRPRLALMIGVVVFFLALRSPRADGAGYVLESGPANPFNGITVGHKSSPVLSDLDGDGDLDVAVGCLSGDIKYLENQTGPDGTVLIVK